MAEREQCVLTNMCMIYQGDNILVQRRAKNDWYGVTFPGGHVEKGESFVGSVIREVKEETGLDITDVRLCGIKQWQMADGGRYIVLFYKTCSFSGELRSSEEGEVFWIKRDQLKNYTLADGFDAMLEVFERDDLSENFFFKKDGKWEFVNL